MRRHPIGLGLLIVGLAISGSSSRADTPLAASSVGKAITGFSLKDTGGKTWSLADLKSKKAVVVVFVGTQCPINNAFMPVLAELHKTYSKQGVQLLAVNSNVQDSAEKVAEHATKHRLPFPVLRDDGNLVADLFGARRTPEAFLLDARGKIRYQGRIDDQFGIGFARPKPTRRDLALAIDELLAGKAVSQPTTPVAGCLIARAPKPKKDSAITYARQVSRILQKNCQECHRPGQIGPMSLLTYRDASAWSDTIREVIEERRMPPWHADPRHGKFQNDRSLSKEDRGALLAWIDAGCPRGDDKDLPAPATFAEGWRIGKPDAVFTMSNTFKVPAKAEKGIKYKYFLVPTNFEEDVWVQAAEARPGNRAVVHHIIVYAVDLKKGRSRSPDGIGNDFLVAHAPGDLPSVFSPGYAKKVPKGATLAFQMHYTPNGVEQTDQSSVGLIFAKKPPQYEVRTRSIARRALRIPAGDKNFKAVASTTFADDALLISMFPHMHLRGKDFLYRVTFPDSKSETLLSVPRYDFNWQNNYRLDKSLSLPAGTRIECTAHYDNSADNPNNPDPTKEVRWGDQTWDEMMIGFVDYALPVAGQAKKQ
jgi:peroxiredoxin